MILAAVTAAILVLAFLFSMLGLGGAMLYIPVLHGFGYDFKSVAIPTGLLLNGLTALTAAVFYLRARMVDVRGSLPLVLSSFLGAPAGAWCTKLVPTHTLVLLFALCMFGAGGRMLLTSGREDREAMTPLRTRLVVMAGAGFFIGFLAGLLGVGGGFLFVPLMLVLGYPTKRAAATSAFVVIFSSFSGFAGHVAEGRFNRPLMIATSLAVIVASWIGAMVMKERMKARGIKRMFGIVLFGVAVKLLVRILF